LATGASIGRKINTIAGHSNGQPSRNIRVSSSVIVPQEGSGEASRALVIHVAVPSHENTAPNTLEATASNSTMLVVANVL
jgi:hypothetical protein